MVYYSSKTLDYTTIKKSAQNNTNTQTKTINLHIQIYHWETMHRHSSDSTNAVIQFIQMKNVLKILLNGQSVGGHLPLRPPTKMLGDVSPSPL